MNFKRKQAMRMAALAALAGAFAVGAPAHAIVYELNKNQAFGTNWNKANDWNDLTTPETPSTTVPGAGDTASTLGFQLRTPDTAGTHSFLATLNINAGGSLLLKTTGVASLADGHLVGGTISQGIANNTTGTIGGALSVDAVSSITLNSTNPVSNLRTIILSASLQGSSNLNVDGGNNTAGAVGTLRVTGDISDYTGSFVLSDQALLQLQGAALNVGVDENGTLTSSGGAVEVGTGSETFNIGRRLSTSTANTGTVDFTGATSVTIDVADIQVGRRHAGSGGAAVTGNLNLSTAGVNTVTANTIVLGFIEGGATGGATGNLTLGSGTNTFNVDTLIVGGNKGVGNLTIANGGLFNLAGNNNAATDLFIGDNARVNTGTNPTISTVDLSGMSAASSLTLDEVFIGRYPSGGSGSGKGALLIGNGTITANSVSLAASIGSNPLNTTGSLTMTGGSFTVAGGIIDGGGVSTLNLVNGTMTVGNGLSVDNFDLGIAPNNVDVNASLTVQGGNVRIGTGSQTVDIGRSNTPGESALAVADFGASSGVDIDVATLRIGTLLNSANPGSSSRGILELSQTGNNVIDAATILIGDSPGSGNTGPASQLILGGATNDITTDSLTIGGQKSNGAVFFGTAGGTLNLGSAGDRVDNLRIAFNNAAGTGADTTGILDGSNGTINAFVSNMVLGHHAGGGSGSGKGTFNMSAGVFDVTSMILAQPSGSESDKLETRGTVNFTGGTIIAGSITKGLGVASFNWTGGTLDVDTFGFDLNQQGGFLAPGGVGVIGTTNIAGNYTMSTDATYLIDVAGLGNNDFVDVDGIANLDGTLSLISLGGFSASRFDFFDVLIADQIILGDNLAFDISAFLNDAPGIRSSIVELNGREVLRLTVDVPEPASAMLGLLGLGALAMRRRRTA